MTAAAPGFIYAELDIHDQAYFDNEYMTRVRPVLAQFGATFVISGGNPQMREGGRNPKRIVLVQFDSRARAQAFYDSPEYQAVLPYRTRSASAHLYILEGA